VAEAITVVEVAPRDGLQNLARAVPLEVKVSLCQRLLGAGVRWLECASFVSPKLVPQMADGAALLEALEVPAGARLMALAPNVLGVERALATRVDRVAVFVAATEGFARANTNCSVADCLARARAVVEAAHGAGRTVRGYVSCITDCPVEGPVPTRAVVRVAEALWGMAVEEVALGDTLGTTRPSDMRRVLDALVPSIPVGRLAVHAHDTYGMAVATTLAAVERGVRVVDGSVAGLGGCPFAPGARGNAASEDLVYMLDGLGFETGIDLEALAATGAWISRTLGVANASRAGATLARRAQK
jgi:hydroxymethylglutaryl-CoA lyase